MKSVVKTILKLSFAFAIVFWLMKSGKLDFKLVKKSFEISNNWLYALLTFVVIDVVASFRWGMLLHIKSSTKISLLNVVRVNWIGLFFSSVLPGAVTGDLIKLVYARDLDNSISKSYLLTSVFLDRLLGLIGLLILVGVCTLLNYKTMASFGSEMKSIMFINFTLFLGVCVFFLTLFLPERVQKSIKNLTLKLPFIGEKICNLLEQFWLIGGNRLVVLKVIALSIGLQAANINAFYLLASPFFETDLSLSLAFTFIPIGLIFVAIPISPAGLGVGHVLFASLFKYVGIANGASLFNLYFLSILFVNLMGVIPYLLSGKRHNLKEVESF